jgi:hypothetical protein
LQRYEAYADRLRRHFQQLQLDRSSIKLNHNEQQQQQQQQQQQSNQNHSFIGPIEALATVNSSQPASVTYKKASQTAHIAVANANRYSYMMAVNTHPVAIKEHRL